MSNIKTCFENDTVFDAHQLQFHILLMYIDWDMLLLVQKPQRISTNEMV